MAQEALPVELQILGLYQSASLIVLGPSDVGRLLAVSKGTISPRLKALASAGYLQETAPGKYALGPAAFSLAMSYLGIVMRQMDSAHELMATQWSAVRAALSQLTSVLPAGSSSPSTPGGSASCV